MKKVNLTINLPNIITVVRILLTPLFVIFLMKDSFLLALVVFTLAGISDALDGLLARCFNQRTELGAHLDPIADKLLLMSAFVSLAILKIIPGWLTVIVISRDILIVLGIAVFTITGISCEIKPSIVSKITTFTQLSTVFLALLTTEISGAYTVTCVFCWVAAGLTILSGLHYIYIGLNILQNHSGNNLNGK